jgi:pimeloyl-ACP methyl ester carboxylesterase
MHLLPIYEKGAITTPDGAVIPYVTMGDGPISIVAIPGAGDGLSTVTDTAIHLAWLYRRRAPQQRILLLSRRQPIPPGYGVKKHASDAVWAVEQLGWEKSIWECNSAGGPVGQWVAVERPDLVRGLILTSSLHRVNEQTRQVFEHWLALIEEDRWEELAWNTIELTYRPQTVNRYRSLVPLLGLAARPHLYPLRLRHILLELLEVDNRDILPRIACPTLVIGGEDDPVIPAEVQREMAELIPNSRLALYAGYRHGNDVENPAYQKEVKRFVDSVLAGE